MALISKAGLCASTIALFCASIFPTLGSAQDARKHLTLLGVPSATVAPAGAGYVALSYANERLRAPNDNDASLSFGHGFGDANSGLGFQLGVEVTSLSDDFADSGYFVASVSKRISTEPLIYVGATAERLLPWGDSRNLDPAGSVMVTGFTSLSLGGAGETPLMWTLGAGTDVRDRYSKPGLFGGVGIGLTPSLAASAAYYGDHAIFGISVKPANNLYLSASLVDAFNEQNDRRAILSAVWTFNSGWGR